MNRFSVQLGSDLSLRQRSGLKGQQHVKIDPFVTTEIKFVCMYKGRDG